MMTLIQIDPSINQSIGANFSFSSFECKPRVGYVLGWSLGKRCHKRRRRGAGGTCLQNSGKISIGQLLCKILAFFRIKHVKFVNFVILVANIIIIRVF